MFVNYNKYNLKGIDAIPNKEFWFKFMYYTREGIITSLRCFTNSAGNIVNKYYKKQAKNSGYSDI